MTGQICEELINVEVFEAGTFRGKTYTENDLGTMVNNFEKYKNIIKPIAVIGFSEQSIQKQLSAMTGLKKRGRKLVAAFKEVPKIVADLVNRKAYDRISSEIYNDYNGDGFAIRRVAFLGGDISGDKTFRDLALYAENPRGNASWICFCETASKAVGFGNAGKQLSKLIEEKMTKNEAFKFSEAFELVQIENPELAREYTAEVNGR